jgi:hypothetical protein
VTFWSFFNFLNEWTKTRLLGKNQMQNLMKKYEMHLCAFQNFDCHQNNLSFLIKNAIFAYSESWFCNVTTNFFFFIFMMTKEKNIH